MQDFKNHRLRWTRAPSVSQEGPASLAPQDLADPAGEVADFNTMPKDLKGERYVVQIRNPERRQ
eukprot:10833644-Prorocentrum_lima.AAC.1